MWVPQAMATKMHWSLSKSRSFNVGNSKDIRMIQDELSLKSYLYRWPIVSMCWILGLMIWHDLGDEKKWAAKGTICFLFKSAGTIHHQKNIVFSFGSEVSLQCLFIQTWKSAKLHWQIHKQFNEISEKKKEKKTCREIPDLQHCIPKTSAFLSDSFPFQKVVFPLQRWCLPMSNLALPVCIPSQLHEALVTFGTCSKNQQKNRENVDFRGPF